jgi:hypothetical protein
MTVIKIFFLFMDYYKQDHQAVYFLEVCLSELRDEDLIFQALQEM